MERFAPKPGTSRRLLDSDSDLSDSDSDSDSSSFSAAAEVRPPPRPAAKQQQGDGGDEGILLASHRGPPRGERAGAGSGAAGRWPAPPPPPGRAEHPPIAPPGPTRVVEVGVLPQPAEPVSGAARPRLRGGREGG